MIGLFISSLFFTYGLAQDTCANGASPVTVSSNGYSAEVCCPGSINNDGGVVTCVTGCDEGAHASCYPLCSDTSLNVLTTSGICTTLFETTLGGSGSTAYPATATMNSAEGGSTMTSLMNTAPTGASTGNAVSTPTTVTAGGAGMSSQSSGGATQSQSTSSSHGAAAMITAAPMLFAGAVAMALV